MSYCTQQDFIDQYGEKELLEVADPDGVGSVSDDVLNEAIRKSDGEINGALRDGGYSPPLVNPEDRFLRHALALTRWFRYTGLRPPEIQEDYDRAMEFLNDIKSGKVKIVQQEHEGSTVRPAVRSRKKVFDDDFVEEYDHFPW